MIDLRGEEWLPIDELLERVPGVTRQVLWLWSSRGVVRSHKVGRRLWLSVDDVLDRERDARVAGWRPGRRAQAMGRK